MPITVCIPAFVLLTPHAQEKNRPHPGGRMEASLHLIGGGRCGRLLFYFRLGKSLNANREAEEKINREEMK